MMQDFFPKSDTFQNPLVSKVKDKSWILNEIGLCLVHTGRGDQAESFYKRALEMDLANEDANNACAKFLSLSELYSLMGDLARSAYSANEGLKLSRSASMKRFERNSLVYLAWAAHLQGDIDEARSGFNEAEAIERIVSGTQSLYIFRGIYYADHLRRVGDIDYAIGISETNLQICNKYNWPEYISRCHRILGDLNSEIGKQGLVEEHYDQALNIARKISNKVALIEALLAKGRWDARQLEATKSALSDLNEALGYAKAGGYRIYETDIRVASAWAHVAAGDKEMAKAEASHAKQMSEEMGYYWGKKDADEVLAKIENS
jgi:tetratricopeptide (TPR) repeat protein